MHYLLCFFFNDTATTEIYTLSLHDALPISRRCAIGSPASARNRCVAGARCTRRVPCQPTLQAHQRLFHVRNVRLRSEEHTSELQSRQYLVCRLLLEKKKNRMILILLT